MSDIRTLFNNPKKRVKLDDESAPVGLLLAASERLDCPLLRAEDDNLPDDPFETDSTETDVVAIQVTKSVILKSFRQIEKTTLVSCQILLNLALMFICFELIVIV